MWFFKKKSVPQPSSSLDASQLRLASQKGEIKRKAQEEKSRREKEEREITKTEEWIWREADRGEFTYETGYYYPWDNPFIWTEKGMRNTPNMEYYERFANHFRAKGFDVSYKQSDYHPYFVVTISWG